MSCVMLLNFFGGVSFVVVLAHPSDQLLLERTPEVGEATDLPSESKAKFAPLYPRFDPASELI
jgi:hypothetical protein